MKKISLFLFVLAILSACVPVATQTSEVSATTAPEMLATTTATPEAPPSPEPTATPESTGIQFERVEANREAIIDYNLDIIYDLNRDSEYFKEIGIASREDLERVLNENNGLLPASKNKNPNKIRYFTLKHDGQLEIGSISMNAPLKAEPVPDIVTPDQKDKKIYPAIVHPWYFDQSNLEPPPQDKSVSVGVGIQNNGEYNEIVYQVVWKNTDFDLFGNKLNGTPDNSVLVGQADILFRSLMYSGRVLSQSVLDKTWWTKHKGSEGGYMMYDNILAIRTVFKKIKTNQPYTLEGPTEIIDLPLEIIQ